MLRTSPQPLHYIYELSPPRQYWLGGYVSGQRQQQLQAAIPLAGPVRLEAVAATSNTSPREAWERDQNTANSLLNQFSSMSYSI